ncbi:hypothetical protein PG993_011180 [Apiospora rasikravindrae]|uniref:Uncharacterized protein n=1 Tax=Apiospora rasikravindrae TaxID=990691 RepID=A0ABR1SDH6_9PEZI
MADATTPLLPGPSSTGSSDSHVRLAVGRVGQWGHVTNRFGRTQPVFLRACHSPWRWINQSVLTLFRFVISAYLLTVMGISLKYKLETEDDHTRWRIPFQFSTVSFILLLLYNLQVTVWTFMHLLLPKELPEDPAECHGHQFRNKIVNALLPPSRTRYGNHTHPFWFSLFYTVSHVFTFMNTIIYWAVLVPAGHGGFEAPNAPHHHHPHAPDNSTVAGYDPHKGLFEEGHLKSFSIINVWSITSVIAVLEILAFNSIRRQTLGKLVTGHAGLFFLDPELMGDAHGAALAASVLFVSLAPGIFSYMYGLIAMRESMSAIHETPQ